MAKYQIPGSNILNMALSVIAKTTVQYYEAVARPLNNIGQNFTQYAPAVNIIGSFQPVPRALYMTLGLDFQKTYFRLFTSNNVVDIGRDVSSDQISFQGRRYQCESSTPWFGLDGWVEVLCIDIGEQLDTSLVFGFNVMTSPGNFINANQNFNNGNFAPIGSE